MIINAIIEGELKDIQATEKMIDFLELRLALIKTNYATKHDYEKNEVEILEMKTAAQIENLKQLITERKFVFEETYGRFIEELYFEDKKIA